VEIEAFDKAYSLADRLAEQRDNNTFVRIVRYRETDTVWTNAP